MRRFRKLCVEECLELSVFWLQRGRLLGRNSFTLWRGNLLGERWGTISVRRLKSEKGETLSLDYQAGEDRVHLAVPLVSTPLPWGGPKYWFLCPLKGCGRRVGKLYLPPGARHFGCRTCHNLTYRSVQKHDRRVDFYKKNPEALWEALQEDNPLALKALGEQDFVKILAEETLGLAFEMDLDELDLDGLDLTP